MTTTDSASETPPTATQTAISFERVRKEFGSGRDATLAVEEFVVRDSSVADRPFQGHRERTVTGDWTPVERAVPAGTLVVPLDQPLGRLVFALLEPRSDDGIVNWNLVDDHVGAAGSVYPVLRRPAEPQESAPRD